MAAIMVPTPPRRRRFRRTPPALVAVVASVVLHVAGLGALLLLSAFADLIAPAQPARSRQLKGVALREVSAAQWEQNRGAAAKRSEEAEEARRELSQAPRPEPKQQEKKKKEPEQIPGKVVATAPGNGQEDPDAEYVAESSNKVQRQTVAKDRSTVYRNAAPKSTSPVPQQLGGNDPVERPQVEGNQGLGQDDRPLRERSERRLALEIPDIRAQDEVQLDPRNPEGAGPKVANRRESLEVEGNSNRLNLQDGRASDGEDGSQGKVGMPGIASLTPSLSVLDSVYGAAPSDVTDDVEEGEGTYLNTREWKYASFFNRLKQRIGMSWDPGRQLRERDPTGNLYSGRDRYTLLKVTLDQNGRVKDLFVAKSCGLDFLDLEAIRSFERAQPFPNPPAAMLGEQSTVTFNFGFFVETGGGPRIHMFR